MRYPDGCVDHDKMTRSQRYDTRQAEMERTGKRHQRHHPHPSDKREKQASAPFAAGSVFNKDPIPDDHALELVEVSAGLRGSDH